jgi:hypothetical protein
MANSPASRPALQRRRHPVRPLPQPSAPGPGKTSTSQLRFAGPPAVTASLGPGVICRFICSFRPARLRRCGGLMASFQPILAATPYSMGIVSIRRQQRLAVLDTTSRWPRP